MLRGMASADDTAPQPAPAPPPKDDDPPRIAAAAARPDDTILDPRPPSGTAIPEPLASDQTDPQPPLDAETAVFARPAAAPGAAPPPDKPADKPAAGLGRATALLSVATLASRVLGLLREQAFAAQLGAGRYGDAFTLAFRLPNLLRDLFAEGALSAAFQPAFQSRLREGRAPAQALASQVATALLILLGVLTLLGELFAPGLVATWGSGFTQIEGKAELTVLLTRILMPFLLLVSLAAVCMGMLNAAEQFLWPALAPALFNLAAIVGGVVLWAGGVARSRTAAIGWAVATLLGGLLQLLCQVVPLYRQGYRFRPRVDPNDPGLRQVLWTMAPATIGLMATQVNIYVSSSFASQQDGAMTWLNVAFRLLQLPIGVFGVAVGTVALSRAAKSLAAGAVAADAAKTHEALEDVRSTLRSGLRMVAFLTLPSTIGLVLLAEPIIALLYQHGAFHRADTSAAAIALRAYGLGLCCYAAVKVAAPVFYALRRARVAVTASVLAVVGNVLWNYAVFERFGYAALALGTSLAALLNLGYLLYHFHRSYGGLRDGDFLLSLARMTVAAGLMALGLLALRALLGPLTTALRASDHDHAAALLDLIIAGGGATAVYAGAAVLLRVPEAAAARDKLRRRLQRRG